MKRVSLKATELLLIGCIALCGIPVAYADTDPAIGFSFVSTDADLFQLVEGKLVQVAVIGPSSVVSVQNLEAGELPTTIANDQWRKVQVIDSRIRLSGLVRNEHLQTVLAPTTLDRQPPSDRLPQVISLAPGSVKAAWNEVHSAIVENQKLAQPLPDPYFARAEIWAKTNSNKEALLDFVTAFRLSTNSGNDLQSYARHFATLTQVLEDYDKTPVPYVPGLASKHYGHGITAYFDGDVSRAITHFNDAIQLEPNEPLYRYFRAIAYKRLGDDTRAQHDALLGAQIEKKLGYQLSFSGGFSRVQGDLRRWLESIRRGGASQSALAR